MHDRVSKGRHDWLLLRRVAENGRPAIGKTLGNPTAARVAAAVLMLRCRAGTIRRALLRMRWRGLGGNVRMASVRRQSFGEWGTRERKQRGDKPNYEA